MGWERSSWAGDGHHGLETVIMLTTPRTLQNYEPYLRPLAFYPQDATIAPGDIAHSIEK
jgi:hypothetical protein